MGIRLLVVLAVAVAATMPADACPAGRPCLKYRHVRRMPPPPPPQVPVRYTRTQPATLDRIDRASLVRFLSGSTWQDGRGDRIRFVDPMHVEGAHFARPPGGERPGDARVVLIRELERTRAGLFVGIDGVLFTLTPCRAGRAWTTCLDESRATDAQLYGGLGYGG
ncbi:MAG: hypothetical protein ACM31C_31640 [Acidobacteriota bacterium]